MSRSNCSRKAGSREMTASDHPAHPSSCKQRSSSRAAHFRHGQHEHKQDIATMGLIVCLLQLGRYLCFIEPALERTDEEE